VAQQASSTTFAVEFYAHRHIDTGIAMLLLLLCSKLVTTRHNVVCVCVLMPRQGADSRLGCPPRQRSTTLL